MTSEIKIRDLYEIVEKKNGELKSKLDGRLVKATAVGPKFYTVIDIDTIIPRTGNWIETETLSCSDWIRASELGADYYTIKPYGSITWDDRGRSGRRMAEVRFYKGE